VNFQSKGLVLLTGAGFTKNFGGFLAIEMWSKVFNHPEIQSSEKLKSLIQNNFNYENIYSDVLNNTACKNKPITNARQHLLPKIMPTKPFNNKCTLVGGILK